MFLVGLFLLLLATAVELYVIAQVAQAIGGWETFGWLVLQGLVGSWIIKVQGIASIRRIGQALDQRSVPGTDLVDGFLLMTAGFLIMIPGFVSTGFGLLLLLPPSRAVVRRFLSNRFKHGSFGRVFIATSHGTRYVGRLRTRPVQDTTGHEQEGPGTPPELPG
jgi:UPF0716 protein FxsA